MCEVTDWQTMIVAVWAIIEYWLGRTSSVKSGSTLEIIIDGLSGLAGLFKKKQQ